MFFIVFLAIGASLATAQTIRPSTTSTTSSTPQWIDPTNGGNWGNVGARICISNKTIDTVNTFAADRIAEIFKTMTIPDFHVSVGNALLTVKPPKVTEMKFQNVDTDFASPARVQSRFYGGRISATGEWSYKPNYGRTSLGPMAGTYRATIVNADVNTTNQLVRMNGKPTAQTVDCKAYLGEFKVDIQGAVNLSSIDNCYDPTCEKIRVFAEDAVCTAVRTFVKDVINAKLATFPNRILIQASQQHKVELNYDLMNNEPKFNNGYLQTGLEGKTIWRGSNYVPFSPNHLHFSDNGQMMSFELSDFVFNSLLSQVHSQGFRFSATQLLAQTSSSSVHEQLSLNCSTTPIQSRHASKVNAKGLYRYKPKPNAASRLLRDASCLGAVFDNVTTSFGEFQSNATGDLVFKSNQKAPSIFVHSSQYAFFDASGSFIEIYGPAGQHDQQQLLARAEIRVLRGEFMPKFVNGNFTGSIKITKFELEKGSIGSTQARSSDDWLDKLTQFSTPMLTDMFNAFLLKYAQFPIPMLAGYRCESPKFAISARTLQVDCDIRST